MSTNQDEILRLALSLDIPCKVIAPLIPTKEDSKRMPFNEPCRTLSVCKLNDGLFHLIGQIWEQELHNLNCTGWEHYWQCIDMLRKYGYTIFNSKR